MYDISNHQSNTHRLVADRLGKIDIIRGMGVDPYPVEAYKSSHSFCEINDNAEILIKEKATLQITGRIMGLRDMGRTVFMDIFGEGMTIQAFFKPSNLSEVGWNLITLLDIGDFVGLEGSVFYTKTNELTIKVQNITVLGKATHPLPIVKQRDGKNFNAISDKGTRYRQRHVDLLTKPASRDVFIKRSKIIMGIRRYLVKEGFLEVETPLLGRAYSGAAAQPFTTRVNALNQEMYLRISPECQLKRLVCGGLDKVFEIGKNFRNEGIDASHQPEFTMLEWYEAYSDYLEQMVRFETLVSQLCIEVNGTTQIEYRGSSLDLTPPWRRLSICDALEEYLGLDVLNIPAEEMHEIFRKHHPDGVDALPEPLSWGTAVVELFEALVEPTLWDPVFVMDHPLEVSPLTKKHRDNPALVERFEPMIACMEVGNSYSELNDPVEQYNRLASQQVSRDEAYDLDEDFMQAINHGMPQAGGTGLGVDRIVMILTGVESIKDVIAFPL